MSSWQYCSRRNRCQICGSNQPDCRRSGKLWFCHTEQGFGIRAINGYRFIKPDKLGVWGIWAPDDGTPFEPSLLDAKPERAPQKPSLTPTQRDVQYRRILSRLTLKPLHKRWLIERKGFTKEAVETMPFTSFDQFTRFEPVDPLTPGVHPITCDRLALRSSGLLVPFMNYKGQILGFQVVAHERIRCELNNQASHYTKSKYTWLSSKWLDGEGPRLGDPYNAPPNAYFEPPGCVVDGTLYLSEGCVKACMISYDRGWPVLGTAGAHFCRVQLRETIEAKEFIQVILLPDSGSTSKLINYDGVYQGQ